MEARAPTTSMATTTTGNKGNNHHHQQKEQGRVNPAKKEVRQHPPQQPNGPRAITTTNKGGTAQPPPQTTRGSQKFNSIETTLELELEVSLEHKLKDQTKVGHDQSDGQRSRRVPAKFEAESGCEPDRSTAPTGKGPHSYILSFFFSQFGNHAFCSERCPSSPSLPCPLLLLLPLLIPPTHSVRVISRRHANVTMCVVHELLSSAKLYLHNNAPVLSHLQGASSSQVITNMFQSSLPL